MITQELYTAIQPCPRCGLIPVIQKGQATIWNTPKTIDTFKIECCGLDSRASVSCSFSVFKWNLKALHPFSKVLQLDLSLGV